MATRKIVNIDASLCNGCGLCISSCAEGAIQLVDGVAKLVKDDYCDGLGACLGECPQGAITVIEREAAEFDEAATEKHLENIGRKPAPGAAPAHHAGCPGMAMRQFDAPATTKPMGDAPSALRQWPVQLHLVSPTAPYFRDADLLLAADCAAFAHGGFHGQFLADHALAIACPKLDDTGEYAEKLATMITAGGVKSITVVMMQVPCCRGLMSLAEQAFARAGKRVPLRQVIIGIEGEVLSDSGMENGRG